MSVADMQKLNVCWNNVYRTLFGMNLWESVKELQLLCNRLYRLCENCTHSKTEVLVWFKTV